jgi:hypothetical protein
LLVSVVSAILPFLSSINDVDVIESDGVEEF